MRNRPHSTRAALWLAVGASCVVHAAGLLATASPRVFEADDAMLRPPVATAVHLRMLIPDRRADVLLVDASVDRPPSGSSPQPVAPTAAGDSPSVSVASPESVHRADTPGTAAHLSSSEAPATVAKRPDAVAAADIVDGYVLRKALSVAPAPAAEIRLAWPAGSNALEGQRAVFTLFIDEEGVIRRMVADGPTLDPLVEESARRQFMAARFRPGEVDGRVVKSLIRIEVVFDNTTPVADAASAPTVPRIVSRQNL